MHVWIIFVSFVCRYEQVRQRIKIHNCWTSGTLQRRMSADIWSTKQVRNKTFDYGIPVSTKDISEYIYTYDRYRWAISGLFTFFISFSLVGFYHQLRSCLRTRRVAVMREAISMSWEKTWKACWQTRKPVCRWILKFFLVTLSCPMFHVGECSYEMEIEKEEFS